MKRTILVLIIFLSISLVFTVFLKEKKIETKKENILNVVEFKENTKEIFPTFEFKERINKKTFGMYINSKISPRKNERFEGIHTGVDVEFEDIESNVDVFSVCDGEIILSKWVNGYGGTVIVKCEDKYFVYGHLNISSVSKNKSILKGEKIGILGKGNSNETDFERKHLHFAINKKSPDLRGYVQNKEELSNWINPLEFGF